MKLEVGCQLTFDAVWPTPVVLMMSPQTGDGQNVIAEEFFVDPPTEVREYFDSFGNLCQRLVMPDRDRRDDAWTLPASHSPAVLSAVFRGECNFRIALHKRGVVPSPLHPHLTSVIIYFLETERAEEQFFAEHLADNLDVLHHTLQSAGRKPPSLSHWSSPSMPDSTALFTEPP